MSAAAAILKKVRYNEEVRLHTKGVCNSHPRLMFPSRPAAEPALGVCDVWLSLPGGRIRRDQDKISVTSIMAGTSQKHPRKSVNNLS